MAIARDASTPSSPSTWSNSSATTFTTGSFSPPAGSLVAVMVSMLEYASSSMTMSVADSGSTSYTQGPFTWDTVAGFSAIYTHYYASAPGSITVKLTRSSGTPNVDTLLDVQVLTGCASSQAGAGSNTSYSATAVPSATGSVTTTATGSWVLTTAVIGAGTVTPNAATTTISYVPGPGLASAFGQQSNPTGTPGPVTLGWATDSSNDMSWAALEILPVITAIPVSLTDKAAAADAFTGQLTALAPAVTAAQLQPCRLAVPPVSRLVRAGITGVALTDTAGAADTDAVPAVTAALADAAAALDFPNSLVYLADTAAAADAPAAGTGTVTFADTAAGTEAPAAAVQLSVPDYGAGTDRSSSTGLTEPDTAAAAETLTAVVTVALADTTGAAAEGIGHVQATGASSGAMLPQASPGSSMIAVAPPGSGTWQWLGKIGHVTALTYSFTCPGGCDQMTATLVVPASYRSQLLSPGWKVRITRGGHQVWTGKLDEPQPTSKGWNLTAVGTGNRGQDFTAIYSGTWPAGQPDDAVSEAIGRGLPWINPGIGQPAGMWFGSAVDSGAQTIAALLNLVCSRGGLTWYVNSQPGGTPGDDLAVFPLPVAVSRLLVATTPVARTLGGDINTIWIRYQATADNTSSGSSGTAATYGTTSVTNAASAAQHGPMETYMDLSGAGVMSAAQAQQVGNYVLAIYQRASFAGPFTARYGQLLNAGGSPVDPGTDQAGTVIRLILTDFGYGGEVTPAPVTFITGKYSWDDFAQVATLTPYQALDHSISGLMSMENTILTPITTPTAG